MINEAIQAAAMALLTQVEHDGYARGIREGASRLETLSLVVPSSVTKRWILNQAKTHAEEMVARLDNDD